jgi:hypothetical protein
VSVTPPVPTPAPIVVSTSAAKVAAEIVAVGTVVESVLQIVTASAGSVSIPASDQVIITAVAAVIAGAVGIARDFVAAKAAARKAAAAK